MSVQTELNKVQEVLTKGIRSKISSPASEGSPCLRLASPSSWVCPACPRRPVSNLHIFFFHLGPSHPDERTEWQTGRQTAVSPVQACTEHTSTRTHVLDPSPPSPHSRRSQSPCEGLEGTSAPKGKGCQQRDHFIHFICFGIGFSFPLCLDGRVSDRIEGVLFGWLVRFSVTPRQRNGFSQEDLLELVIW